MMCLNGHAHMLAQSIKVNSIDTVLAHVVDRLILLASVGPFLML